MKSNPVYGPRSASLHAALLVVGLIALVGCRLGPGGGADGGSDGMSTGGDLAGTPGTDMGPLTCDPAQALCAQQFSWTFTGGAIQPDVVEVRGTFNNWSAGVNPMTMAGGAWQATVELPWASMVEYKFWAKWNDNPDNPLWITDPSNPDQGANGNSLIQSVMCTQPSCQAAQPQLQLVAAPTVSQSAYSFQVKFIPAGAELDASKTLITLNGAPVEAAVVPYDAGQRRFTVSVSSGITAPSKYGYVFSVQDVNGKAASLFVPFWVEATPFQWKDAFMYEVMIDRFLPGGTSKAGPLGPPTDPVGDWKGGDFGGVTKKIGEGYFDAMGVNALWISSPVLGTKLCEMGAGANNGHCLSGYHSYFPIATGWVAGSERDALYAGIASPIDPHFGTAADLKALVNAAHARGIRVLTDLVVNHVFADAHPPGGQAPQLAPLWTAHQTDTAWFNLPYKESVNDCGGLNLWDAPLSQTWNRTNCWFDAYLPDFNTASRAVNDAVSAHAVWLMEEFNLDGFRLDATKQVMNNICSDVRSRIGAAIATGLPFYMVGEALGSNVDNVMDCVGADRLDGSMDDPLHYSIVSTFLQGTKDGNAFDMDVQQDESTWTGRYAGALMGHFFGSHDVPRAISQAAGNIGDPWMHPPPAQETNATAFKRLGLAQAFLLTYSAIPILWMGDEFGMPGSVDPDNRRVMRFGGSLSANEQVALVNLQKLGKARAGHSALRRGSRTRLYANGSFYAYARVDGSDVVVVAFNLDGGSAATHALPVSLVGLTGTLTDALSGTPATVSGGNLSITVPPLTAAVFAR